MPEYIGYVPSTGTGIDWAEKMSGLGDTVESAINTRKREREAYEDVRLSNQEKINDYELGSNQSFNDLILGFSDEARETMFEWNKLASAGEITQSDYKRRMNTLMSYSTQFAETAKAFDERSLKTLERQNINPETGYPDGSGFENFINMQNAKEADLGGSKMYTDPNTGKVFLTKQDEEGNILSQLDVRQANNPGNMVDNRLNLGLAVKDGVKNFGEWSVANRGVLGRIDTETDKRLNLKFTEAKNALIGSILSNDRAIAGVLKDNTNEGYKFYSSSDNMKEMVDSEIEKARINYRDAGVEFDEESYRSDLESKMILVEKDATGVYQPILTEAQIEKAKEIVATEIEIQTGHKESKTGGRAPSGGGSGKSSGDKGGDGQYSTYAAMIDAWDRGDEKAMQAMNPKYEFKLDRSNWEWTITEPSKYVEGDITQSGVAPERKYIPGRVVAKTKKPRQLSNFIFKYGVKEGESAFDKYDREVSAYKSRFGTTHSEWRQNQNKESGSSSYTEADIKATMDANPGATREEVIEAFENQ